MKTAKKLLAIVLACVLALTALSVPAFAAEEVTSDIEQSFYQVVDKLVVSVLKVLNFFIPGINWTSKWPTTDNYQTPDGFYSGEKYFDYEMTDESVWSCGYAYASLLKDVNLNDLPIYDGTYYMAGTLEVMNGRVPTQVYDDQGVTVYALSDGTSGTVVHAVIDGYGLARGDVLEIRNRLADFAKENNIISINVSVLHQHSAIDILGMGAPLLPALLSNPIKSILGFDTTELIGGKNNNFMTNMYDVVAQAIKAAVNDMTEGTLSYGYVNAAEYIHDKREPIVIDENLNRFRFVPYDKNENEIWLVDAGIHCVGLGAGPDIITADFPYYLKEYINNQTGADVVYIQGAELAITTDYTLITEGEGKDQERIRAYGKALGDLVISIDNDIELDPVLNITITETRVEADNQILILAVREGLLNSVVEKDGLGYNVISEVGYMELGSEYTVGIVMAPGEISPEIIWGGVTTAEDSWMGTSWDYKALADMTGADKVICYGLINDQIGYILPDNDYRSMFTENEEINAVSKISGSTVAEAFAQLVGTAKRFV